MFRKKKTNNIHYINYFQIKILSSVCHLSKFCLKFKSVLASYYSFNILSTGIIILQNNTVKRVQGKCVQLSSCHCGPLHLFAENTFMWFTFAKCATVIVWCLLHNRGYQVARANNERIWLLLDTRNWSLFSDHNHSSYIAWKHMK